jgi:nitrogen fixation/metabolism regulation signal transduction histidine kinase
VQDEFPEFARLLGKSSTDPLVMQDRGGSRFGVGWKSVRLAGGPRVSVIEMVPYDQILVTVTAPGILGALVALLGAIPLAALLARSLSRPLVQMTRALEGFSRGEAMTIPMNEKGEIGVLARAFERMAKEVREKAASLDQESERRRAANEKFELAVEASPSGLIMIDKDGKIVLVNAETERMFGYRREELIGRAPDVLVPENCAPATLSIVQASSLRRKPGGWALGAIFTG